MVVVEEREERRGSSRDIPREAGIRFVSMVELGGIEEHGFGDSTGLNRNVDDGETLVILVIMIFIGRAERAKELFYNHSHAISKCLSAEQLDKCGSIPVHLR